MKFVLMIFVLSTACFAGSIPVRKLSVQDVKTLAKAEKHSEECLKSIVAGGSVETANATRETMQEAMTASRALVPEGAKWIKDVISHNDDGTFTSTSYYNFRSRNGGSGSSTSSEFPWGVLLLVGIVAAAAS